MRFFENFNKYKITCKFGNRILNGKANFHYGLDLVAEDEKGYSRTDNILAIESGIVLKCEYNNIGGNCIEIQSTNGIIYYYAHFRDKLNFKKGDKIKKGQRLGYMGNTGNSFGSHLHIGIKIKGQYVDPAIFLNLVKKENFYTMKTLNKKGITDNDVIVFQILMRKLGFYNDIIDGVYGNNSIKAVNAFQNKYKECAGSNGKADGSCGPACWKKLFSLLK